MSVSLERFRPRSLDDVKGQGETVAAMKKLVASGKNLGFFPHLLFHGPPGTGKTTMALAVMNALLGERLAENSMEMNASDERGIKVVQQKIRPWVGMMPRNAPFKILLLEEADQMTDDAQAALRRIMEQSEQTRLILTCNHPAAIIPAIRSRCANYAFKQLSDADVSDIARLTAAKEKVDVPSEKIESIVAHCNGDARRAIHMLLGDSEGDDWLALDKAIEALFSPGRPVDARVEEFVSFLKNSGMTAWESVLENIGTYVVHSKKISDNKKADILIEIGTTAYRCNLVQVPLLQIRAFLYAVVS